MNVRLLIVPALAGLAAATTACGVRDPYNDPKPPTATAPATSPAPATSAAPPETEVPAVPGDEDGAVAPDDVAGAEAVVRRFASTYANWTWDTYPDSRRALVALAAGSLRDQLVEAADQLEGKVARAASTRANRGTVVGVVLQPGAPAFVITRESSVLTSEVSQAGYFTYRVAVARVDGAWKLSEWSPVSP